MKSMTVKIGIYFLILALLLSGLYFLNRTSKSDHTEHINLSYFEDTAGQMKIGDIENAALKGEFVKTNEANLTFGRSHSAFWLRIQAEDAASLKNYIALYCPNIQDVRLFTPGNNSYEVRCSGWGNSLIRNDEGLTYPVFRLDSDSIGENPVYLRIQSSYMHNYTLEFYTQEELAKVRTLDFCVDSFFFGILASIVMLNWIIFFKLKNRNCLTFSICVLLLTIHNGISYGIFNIMMPAHSYIIMRFSIEIGLLFIVSIIIFFIVFSDVKAYCKRYYIYLLFFIAACLIGYPISCLDKVTANLYAHILTIIIPIYILYISFRMYRSGYKDQWLFIIGWVLTILLYVFAMLICEGFAKINFISYHIRGALFLTAIVSVVFTIGLTDHARQLQLEDQQIRRRYQTASDQVKKAETALMQTQIKPHFLYNTLTAIEQLCEVDSLKAQAAISDFSNYLRSNIDFSTETRLILIEQELENVRRYLSLEKMRFEERLNIVYDIKSGGFLIPPLVVQPIVENAVRHGVTKKQEGGTVTVSVGETETAYTITVSDTGVGFDPENADQDGGSHIGIRNARERLVRMCGGSLLIDSRVGVGTTVVISIPKEYTDEPDCG